MVVKPAACKGCYGYRWGTHGFIPPSGSGENGVLVIGEAGGTNEAESGEGFVGKSGHFMFNALNRVGIEREGFRLANILSCQPPENKLVKMAYESEVISKCGGYLNAAIAEQRDLCAKLGKTFVIIAVGRTAFKAIMCYSDRSAEMRKDTIGYPFWSQQHLAWVYHCPHPSYLMRGKTAEVCLLQFVFKRALEVAAGGLTLATPSYLLDPEPVQFEQWVQEYVRWADHHPLDTFLSYDIETPWKQGKGEDEVAKEDGEDFTILRCSFAYKPNEAVSVPWNAGYMAAIEELFAYDGAVVGWNSSGYDDERVLHQMPINGDRHDAMLAWHVLNSALDKRLGFVAPFYCQDVSMWKHLSGDEPAFYNAKDADIALRCFLGIRRDLKENGQGHVFERHVTQLNRVFNYMSKQGVLRDEVMRAEAEVRLQTLLDATEVGMEGAVPQAARKLKVYKKVPKDVAGMMQIEQSFKVKYCDKCGIQNPARWKKHSSLCDGAMIELPEPSTVWAKPLPFKVSKVSLIEYQKVLKHQAIINRKENKVTFDEDAIKALAKRYPDDKLYPIILQHREYSKLLGTYIGVTQPNGRVRGGMPVGRDGRIHCSYTHNPSTLRVACQHPNMQNVPRAKQADDLQTIIRNLIVAKEGCLLIELDFSAIEAVLVGWFALIPEYIRLSKLGIHSFLAAHILGRPADLNWSNDDLKKYFGEIKKSKDQHVQDVYNGSKRAIHLSGYGGTPRKMHQAEPDVFKTVKDAERFQGIYFDLFPGVKKWQLSCQLQAEKDGFLRNPYGYIHRFSQVFSYEKLGGKWVRGQGSDSNKVLAFLPQSTAAGIIKEAMLRLYEDRFEEAGQYLRLQVHDSLLSEVPLDKVEEVRYVMKEEMTKPVPELRLPASYALGECLSIGVDGKQGTKWGSLA